MGKRCLQTPTCTPWGRRWLWQPHRNPGLVTTMAYGDGKHIKWGEGSGFTRCWQHLIPLTDHSQWLLGAPQPHRGAFLLSAPYPHSLAITAAMTILLLHQDRGAWLPRKHKHLREDVGWGQKYQQSCLFNTKKQIKIRSHNWQAPSFLPPLPAINTPQNPHMQTSRGLQTKRPSL